MIKNLLESYMFLSTMYFSLIIVAVLLGIEVKITPFKYSLRNLLQKKENKKWIKGKPITEKCYKCGNEVIPYEYYLGVPYYKCDRCEFEFPYDYSDRTNK